MIGYFTTGLGDVVLEDDLTWRTPVPAFTDFLEAFHGPESESLAVGAHHFPPGVDRLLATAAVFQAEPVVLAQYPPLPEGVIS
jgi:hypothetical protein